MVTRKAGSKVRLRYDCGIGSIRIGTITDHGAKWDSLLPIVSLNDGPNEYDYTIEFPDGYRMGIDERDIEQ